MKVIISSLCIFLFSTALLAQQICPYSPPLRSEKGPYRNNRYELSSEELDAWLSDVRNICSNTVFPASKLGTGIPDATKFLRGDSTWQLIDTTDITDFISTVEQIGDNKYIQFAGKAGGQSVNGGTAAADGLELLANAADGAAGPRFHLFGSTDPTYPGTAIVWSPNGRLTLSVSNSASAISYYQNSFTVRAASFSVDSSGAHVSTTNTSADLNGSPLLSQDLGDARYSLLGHTHVAADITDFAAQVAAAVPVAVFGSDKQVTFNDAGTMAGNADLTFDKTTGTLTTKKVVSTTGGTSSSCALCANTSTGISATNDTLTVVYGGSPLLAFKGNGHGFVIASNMGGLKWCAGGGDASTCPPEGGITEPAPATFAFGNGVNGNADGTVKFATNRFTPLVSPPVTCGSANTLGYEYTDDSGAKCWCDGTSWQKLAGAGTCS